MESQKAQGVSSKMLQADVEATDCTEMSVRKSDHAITGREGKLM